MAEPTEAELALAIRCACAWNNVPHPTEAMERWTRDNTNVSVQGWLRVAAAVRESVLASGWSRLAPGCEVGAGDTLYRIANSDEERWAITILTPEIVAELLSVGWTHYKLPTPCPPPEFPKGLCDG